MLRKLLSRKVKLFQNSDEVTVNNFINIYSCTIYEVQTTGQMTKIHWIEVESLRTHTSSRHVLTKSHAGDQPTQAQARTHSPHTPSLSLFQRDPPQKGT